MLVISIVLILVLALIAFLMKKKLCCYKNRQLAAAAFDKSDSCEASGDKKSDKSQSEFIKSVTVGVDVDAASVLRSPAAFVLYNNAASSRDPEQGSILQNSVSAEKITKITFHTQFLSKFQ
jgi:hypothetical protein